MMSVMEVRQCKPPLMHEEGDGWVKIKAGNSGLLLMFKPDTGGNKPSLHVGVEGVVDESGKPVQVLRYDPHMGDDHMHWFANGWEVKAPLYVHSNAGSISTLGGILDSQQETGILQHLTDVGHRDVALKLPLRVLEGIMDAIYGLVTAANTSVIGSTG